MQGQSVRKSRTVRGCLRNAVQSLCSPTFLGKDHRTILLLGSGVGKRVPVHIVKSCSTSNVYSSCVLGHNLRTYNTIISAVVPRHVGSNCNLGRRLMSRTCTSKVSAVLAYSGNVTTCTRVRRTGGCKVAIVIASRRRVPCRRRPLTRPSPRAKRASEHQCGVPPTSIIVSPGRPKSACPFRRVYNTIITFGLVRLLFTRFNFSKVSASLASKGEDLLSRLLRFTTFTAVYSIVPLQRRGQVLIQRKLRLVGRARGIKLRTLVRIGRVLP